MLSEPECVLARYIGRLRNKLSAASKTPMRRDPNQTDEEMNIQAVAAEMAVAKYLNVYPDLSPSAGRLPKYDLRLGKEKLEVKRNHLDNGDLLIPELDKELVYILACGTMPRFQIIGTIWGGNVETTGEWVELRYGPCWRVHPWLLQPIGELECEAVR